MYNNNQVKGDIVERIKKYESEEKTNCTKDIRFKLCEIVFLLVMTSLVSIIIGYMLKNNNEDKINDKYLEEIINNYNFIIDNYYDDIDKDKLVSGAIDGMINSLDDDYSQLLKKENSSSFYINLEGTYEGIGVEIYNNDKNDIIVLGVIKDSPASRAGIKPGDIIKKIDEKDLSNTVVSDLTKYVQNNKKSFYNLIIMRDGSEQSITIERSMITIKSVLSKTFEKSGKKIGYIYISVFANATSKQFSDALAELENENIDSLIIDVRNNSGGHLTTAVSIISKFLNSKNVIYQIEKDKKKIKFYSTGTVNKNYPIVVLQNGDSASASELLASSLKEAYGATIIGTKSYGKGTVQEVIDLENGDKYKFTTKKWLTPKGNYINKVGIKPDIEIELDEKYMNEPTDDNDNQLQTAIDYLAK